MHLTEALMAAFEATGDQDYLDKAESIADLVIRRCCRFGRTGASPSTSTSEWVLDKITIVGNEMFRPSGTTPGHWLEWARLVLQLWALGGKTHDWMPDAAKALFAQSMLLGWDADKGGFFYTLDWDDTPAKRDKLWWPACEGAGCGALPQRAPAERLSTRKATARSGTSSSAASSTTGTAAGTRN